VATTAHVIAGAEIDHEIELAVVERKCACVGLDDGGADMRAYDSLSREVDQLGIDIHGGQCRGLKARRKYRQRDAATTAYLEHPLTSRRAERAEK
jgi:hypothetical protein